MHLLHVPSARLAVVALLAAALTLPAGAAAAPTSPAHSTSAVGLASADAGTQPRRMVSGWVPYWSADDALATFRRSPDAFRDLAGFWHSATSATSISEQLSDSGRAEVVAAARARGVPVYGTVTDGTGTRKMAAILKSPSKRAAHVRTLVALAVSNGYAGIDLDYEGFAWRDGRSTWAATRPAWVTFIRQLSAALHARGKRLSVTAPVMYNAQRDDSSGYWVYDYASIARSVDQLRIMAYDYSVSQAGPIAPISWVRRVLDFAVTQVPSTKIILGVPAYGRNWGSSASGCPVDNPPPGTLGVTAREAETLAAERNATKRWDAETAETTYSYRRTYSGKDAQGKAAKCTVTRTVWYGSARAVLARATLVKAYQLGGITQWSLGGESSATITKLRAYARTIAPWHPRVAVSASRALAKGTVTVRGAILRPDGTPIPSARWILTFRSGSLPAKVVASGVAGALGRVTVHRTATRTGTFTLVAAGTWAHTAASASRVGTVRLRVRADDTRITASAGTGARLRGQVFPKDAGMLVLRQRIVDGHWTTVGDTRTNARGRYAFRAPLAKPGTYAFRVVVKDARERWVAGRSDRIIITAR